MIPARYQFLSVASALIEWARLLVSSMNTRDAEIERRLKEAEDRLTAGGL